MAARRVSTRSQSSPAPKAIRPMATKTAAKPASQPTARSEKAAVVEAAALLRSVGWTVLEPGQVRVLIHREVVSGDSLTLRGPDAEKFIAAREAGGRMAIASQMRAEDFTLVRGRIERFPKDVELVTQLAIIRPASDRV